MSGNEYMGTLAILRSARADRQTALRPEISENRPYNTMKMVLAISEVAYPKIPS